MNVSQKRAWGELIILMGMMISCWAAIILKDVPVSEWCADDSTRTMFAYILVIGAALIGGMHLATRPGEKHLARDERDLKIMRRAMTVQITVTLASVLLWTVVLTETFHEACVLPVGYLYIEMISILLISLFARNIGIIAGYMLGGQ